MKGYPKGYWLDLPFLKAMQFYKHILKKAADKEENSAEYTMIARRRLAENDLFFLLWNVLGRREDQVMHPWTFERCREVQANPNGYLDLWARDHYKSTIITYALTFLDIINNPEITIGLFSHTKSISKGFLRQIMREMEENKELPMLWPNIFWDKPSSQAPKWSEGEGIIVKRESNPKEATLEAWGLVDGMPTSRHYKLRVYDDVVTRESVSTPEQIHKTTEAFRLSSNLGMTGGKFRVIGTRYHQFDTYHTMIKEEVVKVRAHPCTMTGKADTPEDLEAGVLKSAEELAEKLKAQGTYVFGAQMLLNPNADKTMGFKEEDLRYWEPTLSKRKKLWTIILVDPSSGKLKKDANNTKRDYTAIWVIGLGGDNRWRVLDIVRDKMSLGKRQEIVEQLDRDWNPEFIFYEETGFEADQDYFKIRADESAYEMDIVPIRWSVSKDDRILKLQPMFESGQIILPHKLVRINYDKKAEDLVQVFKDEEYLAYPVLAHDDMLDSLANVNHHEVQIRIKVPKEQKTDYLRQAARQQRRIRPVV